MTFTYTQTDEETGESKEVTEAPTFLLLKWQDDKNLVVTASLAEYDSSKQPQTWVYTLPLTHNPSKPARYRPSRGYF